MMETRDEWQTQAGEHMVVTLRGSAGRGEGSTPHQGLGVSFVSKTINVS